MLPKEHPALGAFMRKKAKRPEKSPDWQFISDELAQGLRRKMDHVDTDEDCQCQDHLSLRVYDAAKWRASGYR